MYVSLLLVNGGLDISKETIDLGHKSKYGGINQVHIYGVSFLQFNDCRVLNRVLAWSSIRIKEISFHQHSVKERCNAMTGIVIPQDYLSIYVVPSRF